MIELKPISIKARLQGEYDSCMESFDKFLDSDSRLYCKEYGHFNHNNILHNVYKMLDHSITWREFIAEYSVDKLKDNGIKYSGKLKSVLNNYCLELGCDIEQSRKNYSDFILSKQEKELQDILKTTFFESAGRENKANDILYDITDYKYIDINWNLQLKDRTLIKVEDISRASIVEQEDEDYKEIKYYWISILLKAGDKSEEYLVNPDHIRFVEYRGKIK